MITTNLSPLGITWSVRINDAPFASKNVQRVNVSFSQNQHDVAIVELVGIPSSYISEYVEKPIHIYISIKGGKSANFYGYVSHAEARSVTHEGTVNNSPFQIIRMVCFGSSHVLRSMNTLSWDNVRLEDVVSDIAKTYRLGYSIPKDNYVFKRLVQTEESLWRLLVKACEQLGYNVTMTNSHIHVWDIDKSIARQTSYTILRGVSVKRGDYNPYPGDIVSIESTVGTPNVAQQSGDKFVSYVDEHGKLVSVDAFQLSQDASLGTPPASRFDNKLVANVDSFEKATRYIQSKVKSSFSQSADAMVYGDPSITPGGIVRVDGYGGDFDGFWYVQSVSHDLFTDTLLTNLKLIKKGSYDILPKFPTVQRYVQPPIPVLIKDKWVMRTEYTNVYN